MKIKLYGHPFAAFVWKALIAAYERGVPFDFCMIDPDHTENAARIAELSPTGQFPALTDGHIEVTQSNSVIEYLDRFGHAPTMIPDDPDAALTSRMLASVFDSYIAEPMQQVVGEALRPEDQQDSRRAAEARVVLDKSYAWLSARIGAGWANGDRFSIADCAAAPALFYADWVHPIPEGALKSYRKRLLERPSVARVVDEARPYRHLFPLGAPDRD
ncbi:glutathione S-transferase family protein [Marinobacter halodurans]|uniref:Glutathione S-transferase family protein n=1 Tax=Marinobacter halodurans TaxID=2528979 RepID=A0ABY1ZHZ2_9GAMM|nr:glutathione S-transferase family protein [Marinobacter halodurans]TBW53346.1 glutathione S-transferase family protein [Marinobacter halodurans]